jgi:aspartyl-tRNA(Asn)/glutamyl-tRNA(Gln) amidotransferase subunit C
MALTLDEVRRISSLARLRFAPDEEATFTRQLGEIVAYIDRLAAYPAAEPAPGAAAAPVEAADRPGDCLPRESFLANAPAATGGFLLVPEVKAEAGGVGE